MGELLLVLVEGMHNCTQLRRPPCAGCGRRGAERLRGCEGAAARPVIMPETVVVDQGRVFVSARGPRCSAGDDRRLGVRQGRTTAAAAGGLRTSTCPIRPPLPGHHSVVRNRRRFLEEEIQELTERLAARRQERADLGEDQARLLRELADGGALEALTALQTALGREEAALGALRHRFDAEQALEASARQIKAKSVELQQSVDLDLRERRRQTGEAILLFSRYAQRLYGEGREAYLAIEAGRSSLSITPRIDADDSRGINNMVIFCFDLTLAVRAHRHGRGPDFLVHDSHFYDGVDERQVARALALAAEVTDEERMQYIVTLNTDTLSTAAQRGFNPDRHIRSPRLTDDEEGGLFGFRFKAAGKA
ncbi:ABC-three component system protein [Streptomyces fagopyri]|uniref:ABC-three component system protein n=1 Tax=Streptomyces fagopyri TaxID=2662397 RepID=UPI00368698AD